MDKLWFIIGLFSLKISTEACLTFCTHIDRLSGGGLEKVGFWHGRFYVLILVYQPGLFHTSQSREIIDSSVGVSKCCLSFYCFSFNLQCLGSELYGTTVVMQW